MCCQWDALPLCSGLWNTLGPVAMETGHAFSSVYTWSPGPRGWTLGHRSSISPSSGPAQRALLLAANSGSLIHSSGNYFIIHFSVGIVLHYIYLHGCRLRR